MQNLSMFCDEFLIAKNQNVIEIANKCMFLNMKWKDKKEEFVRQNIKKENEKETTSTNEICEKQNSKFNSEKKS